MTGARIRRIKRSVAADQHFMLTYGDGLGNIDLAALVAYHVSRGKILTVTGVRPPGRFGELMADPNGRVTDFNEKPRADASPADSSSAGARSSTISTNATTWFSSRSQCAGW